MTAPVLVSSTQVTNTTGAANPVLVVPKPASLAVGDLMIVTLWSFLSGAGGGTDTLPSANWHAGPISRTETAGGSEIKLAAYYCIATSTETAASSFSFTRGTNGTSSFGAVGLCSRITGHDPTTPFPDTATFNTTADNSAALTFAAITTGGADRLIIYTETSFSLGNTNGSSWPTVGPTGTTVSTGASINQGSSTGLMAGTAYKTQATAGTVTSTTVPLNVHNDGLAIGFTIAVAPASGGSTTITPGLGTLVITGYAPAVSDASVVTPGKGALVITGYAPLVKNPTTVTPGVGALEIVGYAPVITFTSVFKPGAGTLQLTGYVPTVSSDAVVKPDRGQLILTGYAPTVTNAQAVFPGRGQLVLTGYAPIVTSTGGTAITPGLGELILTGYAPSVEFGRPDMDLIPVIQSIEIMRKQLNAILYGLQRAQPFFGDDFPNDAIEGQLFVKSDTLYQLQVGAWVAV